MHSRSVAKLVIFVVLCATAFPDPLTHETAPRLSDVEFGLLGNFVALANQELGDWSGWESPDQQGAGEGEYRYEAALMASALALQQVHSVPAYRDLYKVTFDRLIPRMLVPSGEKASSEAAAFVVPLYERLYRDSRWSSAIPPPRSASTSESSPEAQVRVEGTIRQELETRGWATHPGGLQELHDRPWGAREFNHPLVAKVDFPNVLVRQAYWDAESSTLLFALEPQTGHEGETTFRITNIPTNYIAVLEKEGAQIAAIDEHGQAAGKRVRNLEPGTIEITTTLDGPTRFAIRSE